MTVAQPSPLKLRQTSFQQKLKQVPPAVWIVLLLIAFFSFRTKNFLSLSNFASIAVQLTPLLIISCAQTLIVLIQGTDLSLGASLNMVTVIWILSLSAGIPLVLSTLIAIVSATLAGFLNGVIVAKLKLPIFIATLGMANILNSVALTASDGASMYFKHDIYTFIAKQPFLGLPVMVWIGILCVVATHLVLTSTRLGSRIRALGGNPEALNFAGFSVDKATIQIFVMTGVLVGIAGITLASRIESGNPIAGNGFEFNSVAAVLLGGTSMREGRGSVIGTVFGVLLVQVLKNGLVMANVSSIYQSAIIGIVVLFSIIVNAYLKRRD